MRVATILCALLASLLISCSGKTIVVKEAPTPPDICNAVVDHILEHPNRPLNPQVASIFGNCTFFLVHSYRCADPKSEQCMDLIRRLEAAKRAAEESAERAHMERMIQKGRAL